MHGQGIIHRDLHQKSVMLSFKQCGPDLTDMENLQKYHNTSLLERLTVATKNLEDPSTFEIKIIDYGLSREFSREEEGSNQIRTLTKGIGMKSIAAPEQARDSEQKYDNKVDVWYIGVLMLILLSNNQHVISQKEYWTISAKKESDKEEAAKNLHFMSLDGLAFINSLLRFQCADRPSTHNILKSAYLNDTNHFRGSPTIGDIIAKHGSSFSQKLPIKVYKNDTLYFDTTANTFQQFYELFKD